MKQLAGVTSEDVDGDALVAFVSDDRAGAVVTFGGIVRNHDHGVAVTGIEYVGHPTADAGMRELVAEFADREGVHAIAAQLADHVEVLAVDGDEHVDVHLIGGVALFVAVAASHRAQAFGCASDLVERVKERLPIWKKQFLADGTHEWSQCP